MPWTFPLTRADFQNTLRVAEAPPFRIRRSEEVSGTVGEVMTSEIAAPRWEAQFALAPMYRADAARVVGMLEELGTYNSVHLYDPTVRFPASDPTGSGISGATVVVFSLGANNKSLRLAGLPSGYVLSAGDMLSAPYGSPTRRYLGRITEAAVANGAGVTPTFDVVPQLPEGFAVGAQVTLSRPHGAFRIVSFDPGSAFGVTVTGVQFSAVQVPL